MTAQVTRVLGLHSVLPSCDKREGHKDVAKRGMHRRKWTNVQSKFTRLSPSPSFTLSLCFITICLTVGIYLGQNLNLSGQPNLVDWTLVIKLVPANWFGPITFTITITGTERLSGRRCVEQNGNLTCTWIQKRTHRIAHIQVLSDTRLDS